MAALRRWRALELTVLMTEWVLLAIAWMVVGVGGWFWRGKIDDIMWFLLLGPLWPLWYWWKDK